MRQRIEKQQRELIKLKVGSLERPNIDKFLPRLTKGKKRKKTQITKVKNERGTISTNFIEIERIIKEYDE